MVSDEARDYSTLTYNTSTALLLLCCGQALLPTPLQSDGICVMDEAGSRSSINVGVEGPMVWDNANKAMSICRNANGGASVATKNTERDKKERPASPFVGLFMDDTNTGKGTGSVADTENDVMWRDLYPLLFE